MNYKFRQGSLQDLPGIKKLAIQSWSRFHTKLTPENWSALHQNIVDDNTYTTLLSNSYCIVCTTPQGAIIGMSYLVSSGNPTEIYDNTWSYIRFVTVAPSFEGQGIGKKLTKLCIEKAKNNGEHTVALHTSELMHNARHIYESLGFTILKEIDPQLGIRY